MSCKLYHRLASERLDGLLTPAEEQALAAHEALCRDCAEDHGELGPLVELLRQAGRSELPGEERAELLAALAADRPTLAGRLRRLLGSRLWSPARIPSASAALFVLATLAMLARPAEPPDLSAHAAWAEATATEGRAPTLLTVWESPADTIVAAYDPAGAADPLTLHRVLQTASPERPAAVRIYLFERIVVRG